MSHAESGCTESSCLGAVVQKDTTTATETSSANPVVVGHTLTLTATVQANLPGSGSPTGTVTFKDITTVFGTATLNAAGLATFTTSALAVGTHALTVTYAGDTNFASSFSPNIAEVVTASATTTLLSPLPTNTNEGPTALAEIQPGSGHGLTAQRVDDFFGGGGRNRFSTSRGVRPRLTGACGRPWIKAYRDGGLDALKANPRPGRPPKLTAQQTQGVLGWFHHSPKDFGFRAELWTARRVTQLIAKQFGVSFNHRYVCAWLAAHAMTPQKPQWRARERDQARIDRWVAKDNQFSFDGAAELVATVVEAYAP
jgi:transposase